MNYFLKLRFAIWATVVLAVVILTTVGTMLYMTNAGKESKDGKRDGNKRPPQMEKFFQKELGFSEEQAKKAKLYKDATFATMRTIFDSLEKKRVTMIDELAKPNPDTIVLYRLSVESGLLHAKLRYLSVQQLLKLRSICTPEQVKRLNILNNKIIRPEGPMMRRSGKDGDRQDRKGERQGEHSSDSQWKRP